MMDYLGEWTCKSQHINNYFLKLTCGACPEQYDVFKDDKQVGYLRLRHGFFYADHPDCGGERVYESEDMQGDGMFLAEERQKYLEAAIEALDKFIKKEEVK